MISINTTEELACEVGWVVWAAPLILSESALHHFKLASLASMDDNSN
jgi:hypothetical protein